MAVVYAALCGYVLVLHYRLAEAWLGSSLVGSDPPAHFTSGAMVYDYLRLALGDPPMAFAESYYVRYPKVAIGHWPPMYYAVQAVWYGLFDASVASARALSAATAAALAWVLYRRIRPVYGDGPALGAGLVLLVMPLVQRTAWEVMSDLLTGLFVFLALLAFSELLDGRRNRRAGLRFLGWSALAVLTKGTAFALGPFVVLAPGLAGRAASYKARWYWGGGVILAGLAVAFYATLHRAGMGYPLDIARLWTRLLEHRIDEAVFAAWLQLAPLPILGLALLGALEAGRARWRDRDSAPGSTDALVAVAWILAQGLMLWFLPLTAEPRAFLPSLAPMILLMAGGIHGLARRIPTRYAAAVSLMMAAVAVVGTGWITPNPVTGFQAAAQAIPYPDGGTLILVASDPAGEGAFIVERLAHDPRRGGVILRAGPLLAESNWMGTVSRPRFDHPAQVAAMLKALPVRYIVIDGSAVATPELELLAEAVAGDAGFLPIAQFPVTDRRELRRESLWIYENSDAGDRHPDVVRVRLGLDRGGRVLEYHWP